MPKQTTNKKELVMLGDGGVGKTALAASLCGNSFDGMTEATIGTRVSYLDENHEIELTDFGGQEIYQEKYREKLRNLDNAVVLIVVESRSGDLVPRIDYWNSAINGDREIIKHLVVIKSDISSQALDERLLKVKYGFEGIHRTSAKTTEGVQHLRETINSSFGILTDEAEENLDPVSIIVQAMADLLCKHVAENPDALKDIEWRDLERIISTALKGLGFDVTLTPPAKDGGKDVVANCMVSNEKKTFYIEIKHWRKGGRPGIKHISDFIQVNANDQTDGGLFISSSGYANTVHDQINEIIRQNIRLGDEEKIVSLCQRYVRKDGVWRQSTPLPDLLYEDTIH